MALKIKPILILKTGSTLPDLKRRRGDFEDWITAGLGIPAMHVQVVDVTAEQPLPEPGEVAGAVVGGSHAMVTEKLGWSERTASWLRRAAGMGGPTGFLGVHPDGIPVLGICFGHQLLAYALGGMVGYNPRGLELGTFPVWLKPEAATDPLFRGLPDPLLAQLSHAQTVLRPPPGARMLAENRNDAAQAFVVGERMWGVQFHPEFDAEITRAYIEDEKALLAAEGQDAEWLLNNTQETPEANSLLRRFARFVYREAA
jgi:GMP synthase (glutamine-hydrolysing)